MTDDDESTYLVRWYDSRQGRFANPRVQATSAEEAAKRAVDNNDFPSSIEGVEVSVYELKLATHDVMLEDI